MDKTQATQHILTRLRAGYEPTEIAEEMGRILNAPIDITKRFVDQVAASHPEAIPSPAPPVPDADSAVEEHTPPEWMEPLPIQTEPESETTSAAPFESQFNNSDLPPGLQALLNEGAAPKKAAPSPQPASKTEMPLPRQAEFVAPVHKSENLEDQDSASKTDLESLREEVFKQLKKQKRFNDVVEFVCQNTGWHWNKSQRFVARVKTKHHDELMSGQNRLTMLIGIGIIIAGLAMTLYGASVISEYAKLAVFARTNPEVLFSMSPQEIILALMATFTGMGMIIGGGYGISRALTNR